MHTKSNSQHNEKVLLVSEYFAPHWTGIAKAFYYLAQNLKEQGYQTTILTTQFDPQSPQKEDIDGLSVIRVPYQFRLSRTHYSFLIVLRFAALVRKYDAVVINSPNSNILFYSLLTKLFGKRLAIYHQGDLTLPRQTGNQLVHRLMERIFDILTIPSFILADRASTYTRDYAKNSRVMKYTLKVFKPYIPQFKLSEKPPKKDFKNKIDGFKKSHILVGFAGRFVEEKAYENLLKAIPLIVKEVPGATFVFAGKKTIDYEPYFEKHKDLVDSVSDNLYFLGLLGEEDLAYFYESIAVFVLSSRSDCFPTTQIETIQKKTPIVVTDIPGARMLVKKTGFGEVVPVENIEELAKGIIKVLKNPKTYQKHHSDAVKFISSYATFNL